MICLRVFLAKALNGAVYRRFYAELVRALPSNIIVNIEGVYSYAQEKFRRYTWKKCS